VLTHGAGFLFFPLDHATGDRSTQQPAMPLSPSQIAALLGKLNKGKKKKISKAESKRRAAQLAIARKSRWSK
jgi:hypothetical protein